MGSFVSRTIFYPIVMSQETFLLNCHALKSLKIAVFLTHSIRLTHLRLFTYFTGGSITHLPTHSLLSPTPNFPQQTKTIDHIFVQIHLLHLRPKIRIGLGNHHVLFPHMAAVSGMEPTEPFNQAMFIRYKYESWLRNFI